MTPQRSLEVSEELRGFIGRETLRATSPPISESDIRKSAIAVYWPETPPRIFWDEQFASGTRYSGLVAPEDFNPFAWSFSWNQFMMFDELNPVLRREGFGGGGLNGGSNAQYYERMRPGDVITAVTVIEDVRLRQGGRGPMAFVVFKTTESNQSGRLVRITRVTAIRY